MNSPGPVVRRFFRRRGFSLVEITLALGIVSFALLAVWGLTPIGLGSARDAHEEAFAVQILKSLSASLQQASHTTANPLTYTALAPFNNSAQGAMFQWSVGDASQNGRTIFIGENGLPTTNKTMARMIACIQITPPADLVSAGRASLCLAWPPAAIPTPTAWSNSRPQLTNQQGYVETVVYFTPQIP